MKQDEFLLELELKEKETGLYDFKIDGITIYRLIRRILVESKFRAMGMKVMNRQQTINKKEALKNTFLSVWELLKLRFSNRTVSTVFIAFPRVDKVGDYYLDKFVDPLVSLCFDNGTDCIILDQGRGGCHAKPRLNDNHCVKIDWVVVYSRLYAKFFYKKFCKSHQTILNPFCESVCSVFELDANNINVRNDILYRLFCILTQIYYYKRLFQHLKCQRVIGPSRNYIRRFIVAAHLAGAKAYELQHGIVDGIRIDNSGFQPMDCTPDKYLAYGDSDSMNYHGIEPEKVVNIGWAFSDYISSIKGFFQYKEQDVLVISDPTITDIIIDITLFLAKNNPESHFYVRPHPHEEVSKMQKSRLNNLSNVHWQDRRINISIVMRGFTHVIGENSSVVYEALAAGKKVGRLSFEGLNPFYLRDDDRDCFWVIKDQESFKRFISEDVTTKKSRSIYSSFNKELFMKTIGIG